MDRQTILATSAAARVVPAPQWGGDVRVVKLSAIERVQFYADVPKDPPTPLRVATLLLTRCIRDENGQRVFSDEDAAELENQDPDLLDQLAVAAHELNQRGPKAREAAEKKSPAGSSDSGCA